MSNVTVLHIERLPFYEAGLKFRLSRRQLEVMRLALQGLTAKAIGRSLAITEGTVRAYLHVIYDKIGVRTRGELMQIVMKHTNVNSGEPKMAPESPGINDDPMAAERIANETDEQRRARVGLSSVRITDHEAKRVQKTPNRISLDSILEKIVHTQYIYPAAIPHMTIAVVILDNGFAIVGKSAPADPENFNLELGQKFAKEDAIRQIWPLEAYLLREKLTTKEEW